MVNLPRFPVTIHFLFVTLYILVKVFNFYIHVFVICKIFLCFTVCNSFGLYYQPIPYSHFIFLPIPLFFFCLLIHLVTTTIRYLIHTDPVKKTWLQSFFLSSPVVSFMYPYLDRFSTRSINIFVIFWNNIL